MDLPCKSCNPGRCGVDGQISRPPCPQVFPGERDLSVSTANAALQIQICQQIWFCVILTVLNLLRTFEQAKLQHWPMMVSTVHVCACAKIKLMDSAHEEQLAHLAHDISC